MKFRARVWCLVFDSLLSVCCSLDPGRPAPLQRRSPIPLFFCRPTHVPVLIPFVVTSRPTTASRPSNPLNPSLLAPQIRLCGPLCAFIIYLYAYLLTYLDDGWRKADAGECQHCRPGCSAPADTVVRASSDTGELALQAWPKSLWKSSITSTSSVSSYVWAYRKIEG